jgi:hypothetical protein
MRFCFVSVRGILEPEGNVRSKANDFAPKRKEGIVRHLGNEVLVYDEQSNKAHCLNDLAGRVWQKCDGKTPVAEIARELTTETGTPVNEDLIWLAVRRLDKAGLLKQKKMPPVSVSRRMAIRTLSTSLLALPAVVSILMPTTAEAASCAMLGQSCASVPCCSGLTCLPLAKLCG